MVFMDKDFCQACGGVHPPDPDDSYVDFRGYRFQKPFLCICCGKEICGRQFAFGRACGPCDMGSCQSGNKVFMVSAAHNHPPWWDYDAKTSFQKYVAHTKATPVPAGDEK